MAHFYRCGKIAGEWQSENVPFYFRSTLDCFHAGDPIEGLARIALDPNTDVAIKVRCFIELAAYVYSKRKPIDSMPESSDLTVNVEFIGANVDSADCQSR